MKNIKDFILEAKEKSVKIADKEITLDTIVKNVYRIIKEWDISGIERELRDNCIFDILEFHGGWETLIQSLGFDKLDKKDEKDLSDFCWTNATTVERRLKKIW